MKKRSSLIILLLLSLFLVLALPTFAQEVTPEPAATVVVNPTVEPIETPAPVEQPSPLSWLSQVSPWLGAIAIVALVIDRKSVV